MLDCYYFEGFKTLVDDEALETNIGIDCTMHYCYICSVVVGPKQFEVDSILSLPKSTDYYSNLIRSVI